MSRTYRRDSDSSPKKHYKRKPNFPEIVGEKVIKDIKEVEEEYFDWAEEHYEEDDGFEKFKSKKRR
jgi:hypothetical protein